MRAEAPSLRCAGRGSRSPPVHPLKEIVMRRSKSGSLAKRARKPRTPRLALYLPRQAQDLYPYVLAVWLKIKADVAHFASTMPPAAQVDANLAALLDALKEAEG